MLQDTGDLHEFHWIMDMLQTIEVGLVVLDRDYRIHVWNGFMENHSGFSAQKVREQSLFDVFEGLPEKWIRRKIQTVLTLKTRTFTTWEQRPYLFPFRNCRPITGTETYMYQNITFSPLTSATGEVDHVCLLVYDVTDNASSRRRLERANAQLEQLSQTDRLTGLLNRGTWESLLVGEFERFRRYRNTCSLVMFDIDHFKHVNDTYGHHPGDEVLRVVSRLLRDNLRQTDIAGRYGGEEFTIILPETGMDGAMIFAERLRAAIEATPVDTEEARINCTISLGVSVLDESLPDYLTWMNTADKALYQSKEGGRNRVTLWQDDA